MITSTTYPAVRDSVSPCFHPDERARSRSSSGIVNVRAAGEASSLPTASLANAVTVCVPDAKLTEALEPQ